MRPSSTARTAFWIYLALIGYASLYPFEGWRDTGVDPWAFVLAPWPRYLTRFDIITNVLAYLPIGGLCVLSLHPRLRGLLAVVVAVLLGGGFSALIEALQTWLPTRVSSNLDLACNTAGTLLGALIAGRYSVGLLERNPLRDAREQWFGTRAAPSLVLVGLWFAAQLYPQAMLFGVGDILTPLAHLLGTGSMRLLDMSVFAPEDAAVAEAACSASALAGTSLLLLHHSRSEAPRSVLLLLLAVAAIATRCFAGGLAFGPTMGPGSLVAWATPGARLGLAGGIVLALACSHAPRAVRRSFAVSMILCSVLVVNLFPENPYFSATLANWQQGAWINFNGLLRLLGAVWPVAALLHLSRPLDADASAAPPIIRSP